MKSMSCRIFSSHSVTGPPNNPKYLHSLNLAPSQLSWISSPSVHISDQLVTNFRCPLTPNCGARAKLRFTPAAHLFFPRVLRMCEGFCANWKATKRGSFVGLFVVPQESFNRFHAYLSAVAGLPGGSKAFPSSQRGKRPVANAGFSKECHARIDGIDLSKETVVLQKQLTTLSPTPRVQLSTGHVLELLELCFSLFYFWFGKLTGIPDLNGWIPDLNG